MQEGKGVRILRATIVTDIVYFVTGSKTLHGLLSSVFIYKEGKCVEFGFEPSHPYSCITPT